MKYKIFIDLEADNYLREWTAENKRYALDCPSLASDYELHFEKDKNVLFIHRRRYGYNFSFKKAEKLIAKGKLERTPKGENDFGISFGLAPEIESNGKAEPVVILLKGYLGTFLNANAYLMYGNILGEKEYVAAGRNEGGTKVITFRKHKDTVYAIHTTAHRSPEGVFSVRGHFRHYKSGKVVWIDEYIKGVDKDV